LEILLYLSCSKGSWNHGSGKDKQLHSSLPSLNDHRREIQFDLDYKNNCVEIETEVQTLNGTGVEMEALSATAISALTIYDMCKSVDKKKVISNIHLVKKTGGRGGDFFFKKFLLQDYIVLD
jgi:molybdenum cofactor biosynthesis enzyme